jgi:hypothetical protein
MNDSILYQLNLLVVPDVEKLGFCCKEKMQVVGEKLICAICKSVKSYVNDIFDTNIVPDSVYYKIGNTEFVTHIKREKSPSENIAKLYNEVAQILEKNQKSVQSDVIDNMSKNMYAITNKKIKKSKNREDLRTALLYLSAQQNGKYYTIKDVSTIFGRNKHGISKGKKYILEAIFDGEFEFNFDAPIHHLVLKKYLELVVINGECLYQLKYAKYCKCVVDCMLENNIAYNSTIQSKCIGVIYYLIHKLYPNAGIIKKQKNFSQVIRISENTYTRVYNTLVSSDSQQIISAYICNYLHAK